MTFRNYRPKYWKLDGSEVVPCENVEEWATTFEQANRRVQLTQVGEYQVSTVFLGLDHNWSPEGSALLFETMIFLGTDGQELYCDRYSTWAEAEAGHARAIEWLFETHRVDRTDHATQEEVTHRCSDSGDRGDSDDSDRGPSAADR